MIYLNFFSCWKPTQIQPQKNKTINHSQDPFDFAFPRMQLFILLQHQNETSNLSLKWILKTDWAFLLLLYLPWVLNLEDLGPMLKTLWFHFSFAKGKPPHNFTLKLFNKEAKFICWMTKQHKQTTSQVNTSWHLQNWNTYNATWLHLN